MPGYAKVLKSLWIEERFVSIPEESRHLLLYLMTSPHANSLGYYRLPNQYICADLQWDLVRVEKAWEPLQSTGLAFHCSLTQIVFLPENFSVNSPENPNVIKKWKSILRELPFSPLLKDFIDVAKKYLPNGWQSAWLSEFEKRVSTTLPDTLPQEPDESSLKGLAEGLPKGLAEGLPKGLAKQETRNKKPVTRNPKPEARSSNTGMPPASRAANSVAGEGKPPGKVKTRLKPRQREAGTFLDMVEDAIGTRLVERPKLINRIRSLLVKFPQATPEKLLECFQWLRENDSFCRSRDSPTVIMKLPDTYPEWAAGKLVPKGGVSGERKGVRPKPEQGRRRPITYIGGAETPLGEEGVH